MKKISTITFHASHNYGSCLQAYALQETIKKIANNKIEYEIINLRTPIQKEMYKLFFEKKDFKSFVKSILFYKNKKELYKKQELFELFLNNYLNLSKEYSSLEELEKEQWSSDIYIAGSDQLWNKYAIDFDWANYLEFIKKGKKISYAASFGPRKQEWSKDEANRIKNNLKNFEYISVREKGSFDNVKKLIGVDAEVHVDPTLLLKKEEWEKILPNKKIYNKDYIFLYNLKDKEYVKLAHKISKRLKLPVLISKDGKLEEIFYGFKRKFDVGPLEFLLLIKNAKLVLSSSFHGTIFSIIFHKPFFALKGKDDFRIQTLLKKMNLENRSIDFNDYKEKCKEAYNLEFNEADKLLEEERKKSKEYLERVLELKKEKE